MRKDYSNVARMHTPISKSDLNGSPSGPVTTYYLPPDVVEQRYGKPVKNKKPSSYITTAKQSNPRGLR